MRKPFRILLLSLLCLSTAFILTSFTPAIPDQGSIRSIEPQQKTVSACYALLTDAAAQAGVQGTLGKTEDYVTENGLHGCYISYNLYFDSNHLISTTLELDESNPTPAASCKYDPLPEWTGTTLNGYNARTYYAQTQQQYSDDIIYTFEDKQIQWCMHKGERNYYFLVFTYTNGVEITGPAPEPAPIASVVANVAEGYLPLTDDVYEITEEAPIGEIATEPTEEPGEVAVIPDENDTEASTDDGQPVAGVPDESSETTGSFQETWDSVSAGIIRNPLIPILGGLIGTGLAWLLPQGISHAAGSAVINTATPATVPQSEPPSAITETPAEPETATPAAETEPPPEEASTSTPKEPEKVDPYALGLSLLKDPLGAAGTIADLYPKYLDGKDSAETVAAIREAVQNWHHAPSADTAANYLEKLNESNALRESPVAKKLKLVNQGLDVVDAFLEAQKLCNERHYTGTDALLTHYAKLGEKAVGWMITDIPGVGLADAAVGSVTQLAFGADNAINLGNAIEKADYAWDNLTRHASERYNRYLETEAESQKAENLQFLTERIRRQVEEGKISKQEGASRLQRVMDKFNQESPIL